jgi:hypothetical protein
MTLAEFFSNLWGETKKALFEPFYGVKQVIPATASIVGETAKNLLSPLLPILAVLVLVYAFGSTR